MQTMREPGAARLFRMFAVLLGGVIVVMLVSWILGDPVERVETDWTAFDRAGDRIFTDEEIYRPYIEERLPYLYPPFLLWLTVPLRFLGFWGSFAFSVGLSFVTSVLAYRTMIRLAPVSPMNRAALTAAVFSGTTISASLIGQYSGIWALSLAGALALWERDRPELAGVALAVLLGKPNLGVAVIVLLVWSRSWRMLRGFGAAGVALVVSSLPFGLSEWPAFIRNVGSTADVQLLNLVRDDKMITLPKAFQMLTGLPSRDPAVLVVFVIGALVTGVAVLALWTPTALQESRIRAIGGAALFLVAANPRLYFYDGTLMIVGALAVWAAREHFVSDRMRNGALALSLGLWVGSWGGVFLGMNIMVGPLAAALVVLWAVDTRKPRSASELPQDAASDQELAPTLPHAA